MARRVCPMCGKTFTFRRIHDHAPYPFCGERCQQAELGDWLDGRYVISRPLSEDDWDQAAEAAHEPAPPDGEDNETNETA